MDATDIRDNISAALQHEERTGEFARRLETQLPRLQASLVLPENEPVPALLRFVTDYVQSIPGCLSLVSAVSKRLGFFDYAAPFLRLAKDYFLQPPGELPDDGGLEALLDEAFLAHRLLEEVNDHHIRHLQRALLPVDMTEANIIVHQLLGDEFATRLEELVSFTAAQLLDREHLWDRVRALPGDESIASERLTSASLTGSPHQVRLRLAM